jgi:prepilin-type N-terminal cleavage/methylation domain-containing protein
VEVQVLSRAPIEIIFILFFKRVYLNVYPNGLVSMGTNIYTTSYKKYTSGFTIVELLIVVVVIAILAAITIVSYNGITKRANESTMQSAAKQVGSAISLYKADNGAYPASLSVLGIDQTLYSDTSLLWAYTTSSADQYCLSVGSSRTTAIFHVSDGNGGSQSGICSEHTVAMLASPTSPAGSVTNFPTRGGYTDITLANVSSPADNTEVQIGSVPTGSWMIVVFAYTNAADPTPPAGWTTLVTRHANNSLYTSVYGKIKQAGDASQQYFDAAGTNGTFSLTGVFLWGGNGAAVNSWTLGAFGDRASNATATTTVTPTVSTTVAKTLVLSFSTERTVATETNYVSLVGATPWIWIPQYDANRLQTIAVGYEEKTSPGTSSAMTVTYPNTQATNGLGFQIAIPPAP